MTAELLDIVKFFNNEVKTNVHKCNILHRHAQYCGGGYQYGPCESS